MFDFKGLLQKLLGIKGQVVEENIDHRVYPTSDPHIGIYRGTRIMHVSRDTARRIMGAGMQ